MNFNRHSELEGFHAFLSASKYHWVNYDEERLEDAFSKYRAKEMGTRLHDLAKECILLGVKLPKTKQTLNMYVNDAIGFKMTPEQPLFYSRNCFGTADSIAFRKSFLRIHDLKNGTTPTSMTQLEIYTALFCLEYDVNPNDIEIELRIYQSDEISVLDPERERILYIMGKIIDFDRKIEKMKMGE